MIQKIQKLVEEIFDIKDAKVYVTHPQSSGKPEVEIVVEPADSNHNSTYYITAINVKESKALDSMYSLLDALAIGIKEKQRKLISLNRLNGFEEEKKENTELLEEIEKLKIEAKNREDFITELKDCNKETQERLTLINETYEDAETDIIEMIEDKRDLEEKNGELEAEVSYLKAILNEIDKCVAVKDSEIRRLTDKVKELTGSNPKIVENTEYQYYYSTGFGDILYLLNGCKTEEEAKREMEIYLAENSDIDKALLFRASVVGKVEKEQTYKFICGGKE